MHALLFKDSYSERERKNRTPHSKLHKNFLYRYILTVAVARSSEDNAICYVLPVLLMTSRLPIIGQAKARQTGRILKVTHQGAERGAKCDAYDSLVRQ